MTGIVSTVVQQNIDPHPNSSRSSSTSSSVTNSENTFAAAAPLSHPSAPVTTTTTTSTSTTSPLSGAVPAQLPVRSYATATKTATPPTSAGASAPAQHAKPAVDSQMNGAMAQGGSQPASNPGNAANGVDHGRKPSVVINASGASGYTPNGGPVAQNGRPAISFGSMGSHGADPQSGAPFTAPNPSLGTPQRDARVITPTHSPSPIPQPMAASGGRPPSSLQNANNGLNFGSIGPDNDMMRGGPMPQGPASQIPMHERRTSSQSDMSNANMPGMNRQGFVPPNAGRGRQSFPQQPFAGSPGPNFRPLANQGRGNMPSQFQPVPPGSPYARDRATPQQTPAQPMQPMGGHPQMPYGAYQQHLGPHNQAQGMYGMPGYDPNSGYYQPYYYPPYGAQVPPQSPRPQYPSPFPGPPGAQMQPPFHPPGTPGMVRTPSQASERPPSSLGGPQTPMQHPPPPSQTPNSAQQASSSASSSFVRPKKSSAIKITDAQGNAINFAKPSSAPSTQAQPSNPVIVSTPNAPTPPPRVPSSQHNRTESKSTKTSEETKNAFAEQVKRQLEEDKRKQQEEAAKTTSQSDDSKAAPPAETQAVESDAVKEATATAEKAAAVAANDEPAKADADAAAKAIQNDEDEKKRKEREEEERIEREIAEMEAAEREEEERERAFQEKRAKEKEASAAKEKEKAAKADEELKRQEREAEEREAARQQEREGEKTEEPDDEAKALFASLKKPTLGPGASAPESGRETPVSETAGADSSNEAAPDTKAPQTRAAGGQKPKPAHLKLETSKPVERAEPTPGMQALKSARFLEIKEEPKYPDGFKSPNPALNQNTQRKGRAYDKDFLLQFQDIFKEKPSVDWDLKVKETLGPGDEPGSARPQSARTPSGQVSSRSGSNRPGSGIQNFGGGPMGNFGGMRTLPAGTTSEQRFQASTMGGRPGGMGMPQMARAPSNLGIGGSGVGMSRTNSLQMMGSMGAPNSPRQQSARGKGGSKRDDRTRSVRQEAEMASKMPLTAHMEITPLERSTTGWKATSLGQAPGSAAAAPDPSGNMAPDLVQRKVKAALNKMTPEKFDKISDQILEIAAQSKNESDGRTLRQVIQLTFEKACDEAHWAGMYAQFCHKMLTTMSPEIRDETIKDKNGNPVIGGNLFRKYLLNRCQEEFERGWQVNLPDKPEGESQEVTLLSDEYYVAAAAKRRGLGLIQFIGQLYKLRMLTLRIMHECVMRLLNFEGDPDEAAVENLTTLLKAVGATMDEEEQGKQLLVTYFSRIEEVIMRNEKLPSRPKFMIMDLIDLRRAGWKGKDDSKGPKTIQQIHEEAEAAKAKEEAERQRSSQRGAPGGRMPQGRGDARNFSGGMPPPVDFARTNVNMDDLRKLQARGAQRQSGGGLGPGGSLGPSTLGARSGSRRGNLGPGSSGNTTRTNTPPVDSKKEEPTQQNAFSALAALDPSGEGTEDNDAASPPATQNRSKSPLAAAADDASSTA